ncbi:MAG: hypothetical protein AB9861_04705 [Methanosarcina sp.]
MKKGTAQWPDKQGMSYLILNHKKGKSEWAVAIRKVTGYSPEIGWIDHSTGSV